MKIAVCYSGSIRVFLDLIDTHIEHLLSKFDCDVFLETWNVYGNGGHKLKYEALENDIISEEDKNIIFDKHRGWPNMISALRKIKYEPKILCTVRPIPEIIVSYIKLIEKNPDFLNFIDEGIKKKRLASNTFNRAMTIWFECIHPSYSLLRDIVANNRKNFLIIQYDEIVNNPMMVLNDVNSFSESGQVKLLMRLHWIGLLILQLR